MPINFTPLELKVSSASGVNPATRMKVQQSFTLSSEFGQLWRIYVTVSCHKLPVYKSIYANAKYVSRPSYDRY